MAAWLNNCRFNPTLGGTTDWTYSSAVTGFQSPASAGVVNSTKYKYNAISADQSQWEIGEGAYNTGTSVLARTTVLFNSSGTGTGAGQSGAGTKISFSTVPLVAIVAIKEDLISVEEANSFSSTQKAQARTNIAATLKGHLFNLTLSTAGASTTFSVAAGEAADSTSADLMVLAASISKTTAAWVVGSGNGSFDGTGSAPSATAGWYHVYLIKRPDTGVVDVLISISATAPTLPANYTTFRRIGSLKTNGSFQWIAFQQVGDEFIWDVFVLDVNGSGLSTTSTLFTMSVPPGVSVLGRFRFEFTTTSGTMAVDIQSPLITTRAGTAGAYLSFAVGSSGVGVGETNIMTNTSSQIRAVANASGGTQLTYIGTHSWIDTRGKF